MRILYVEDEAIKRETVVRFLSRHGHEASGVETAEEALALVRNNPFEILITDVRLPGMDGTELLRRIRQDYPRITVLVVTAFATIDLAVQVMRDGAFDFLTKPFRNDVLQLKLQRIADFRGRGEENAELRRALGVAGLHPGLIGESAPMRQVADLIRTVAPGPSTVLILGESGTGKELVARAIHDASGRPADRFVAFSCAALPTTLAESELFGHEKGAFTGAFERRHGRFERAQRGTLFLDDIDAMPLEAQSKLLRVLEEKRLERVGSSDGIDLDVRVVASARPDLKDRVAAGAFREDLYFRLNVIPIVLPPLRERGEDLTVLLEHFVQQQRDNRDCAVRSFSEAAIAALHRHSWPGNVRELRNLVERLCWVHPHAVVDLDDLPPEVRGPNAATPDTDLIDVTRTSFRELTKRVERAYFSWALEKSDGNLSEAARLLDIPRSTLRDRLRALDRR